MNQMDRGRKVPGKKPYTSPTLWVHGGIGELTQSSKHKGFKVDVRSKTPDRTA